MSECGRPARAGRASRAAETPALRTRQKGVQTMTVTPAPDTDIQDFADMSAALTGFQSSVLKPALDPVQLARTYYTFAVSQVGQSAMTNLLNAYRAIKNQPAQQI